jgi:crotonobetainyl-CoA:carnitine CoA-transferase CaiB-like acyl-CoA transferase
VALSVTTDEQWGALVGALGAPAWAEGLELADARHAAHDRIDDELASWCAGRDPDDVADLLCGAGVPAAAVMPAVDAVHNAQIRHRGLYEDEDHPVTGVHAIPGLPFRFSHVDRWARRASPTIGEHNDEVLGEVASNEELDELRAKGVIGEGLAGAD